MQSTKLAIISDLHVGKARANDLNPNGTESYADDHFLRTFVEFVQKESLTADYLLIPGDMSNTGNPKELKLASSIIEQCAEALSITFDNIFFVPGNHDVNWNISGLDDEDGDEYHELRYEPLKNKRLLFHKLLQSCQYEFYDSPYFSYKENDDVFVLAYNSTWDDGPKKRPHYGMISKDHIKKMDSMLSELNLAEKNVKLFMVHHHPINYSSPNDHIDFSSMQNAEDLLDLLHRHEFDILIHGHKHYPRLKSTNFGGYKKPIIILGSGSFCAKLFEGWNGYINNQFHIIDIEGRHKSSSIFGRVRSWTYLSRQWRKSTKAHHGIEHLKPFGGSNDSDMEDRLVKIISTAFTDNGYLKWSSIIDKDSSIFQYITTERRNQLLNKVEKKIKFDRHITEGDEIILLKPVKDE